MATSEKRRLSAAKLPPMPTKTNSSVSNDQSMIGSAFKRVLQESDCDQEQPNDPELARVLFNEILEEFKRDMKEVKIVKKKKVKACKQYAIGDGTDNPYFRSLVAQHRIVSKPRVKSQTVIPDRTSDCSEEEGQSQNSMNASSIVIDFQCQKDDLPEVDFADCKTVMDHKMMIQKQNDELEALIKAKRSQEQSFIECISMAKEVSLKGQRVTQNESIVEFN